MMPIEAMLRRGNSEGAAKAVLVRNLLAPIADQLHGDPSELHRIRTRSARSSASCLPSLGLRPVLVNADRPDACVIPLPEWTGPDGFSRKEKRDREKVSIFAQGTEEDESVYSSLLEEDTDGEVAWINTSLPQWMWASHVAIYSNHVAAVVCAMCLGSFAAGPSRLFGLLMVLLQAG